MKKYVFYDLQTAGYSAHTTMEGLAEMLIQDWLKVVESEGNETELNKEKLKWSNASLEQMIKLIESYNYEILEATEENIRNYELYQDAIFE